jgi:hypothetical protein
MSRKSWCRRSTELEAAFLAARDDPAFQAELGIC